MAKVNGKTTQATKADINCVCDKLALMATDSAPLTSLLSSPERLTNRKISVGFSIINCVKPCCVTPSSTPTNKASNAKSNASANKNHVINAKPAALDFSLTERLIK